MQLLLLLSFQCTRQYYIAQVSLLVTVIIRFLSFLESSSAGSRLQPIELAANSFWPYTLLILFTNIKPHARTDGVWMQYVDAISIDIWNAGINSKLPCSKVCNREDRYAITHARSDTLKSSRDAVNFCCGN